MSATVYFYVYGRYKTITLFFNSFSLKGYRRPPQNVHFCAEDRIVFGRDKEFGGGRIDLHKVFFRECEADKTDVCGFKEVKV